jgi:gliding motility-associatede transport system auxiliary component
MNRWARRARAGSLSLVITVVILAALVAANLLVSRSTQALDLTHGRLNTLAPQSVLAAQRLTSDLQVVGLFRAGTEYADNGETAAEALISLYAAQSSHVKYRRENVDTDSADVKKYAIKEPNTVVLGYKGKTALLTPSLQGEVDFTAALLRLESDHVPLVCWAVGDGERGLKDANQVSGYSGVADMLANNNFSTRDVLLSQVTSIPSDCDELAVIDPTTALPAPSVKAVGDYLAAGGKLLIAAEPWAKDAAITKSLNAALKPYGLGFSGALVVETDPSRRSSADATIPAVTAYGGSPITSDLQGRVSFFPLSTAITGTSALGVTTTPLATTSNTSYAIAQARAVQDLGRKVGDVSGPFNIMEAAEKPAGDKRTRIVMVGTADFAENRTLPPNNSDWNLELTLASFQWLAEQDSLISIPPKAARALPLALTQQDQSTLIFITGVLLPGLMVFGGVMVWWRRRVFS